MYYNLPGDLLQAVMGQSAQVDSLGCGKLAVPVEK